MRFALRWPRRLATRLTLWHFSLLALCVGVYSTGSGLLFSHHVRAEIDRRVQEDIELAARALSVDREHRAIWIGGELGKQIPEEPGGGHWVEVWNAEGDRVLAAGSIDPPVLGPPFWGTIDSRPATSMLVRQLPLRVQSEQVQVDGRHWLVRVAVSELAALQSIRDFWRRQLLVSLMVLSLGALGGYWLTRQALAPFVRLAARARRITADQLDMRFPEERAGAEIDQIRRAFNHTLERLERSFTQLRRFTADVAHELRTPLTALRSVGEVGLRSDQDSAGYREVIGSMLEEVDHLTRLADQLLLLARAEGGQVQLHHEPIEIAQLARDVCVHLAVLAEERGQMLEVSAPSNATLHADRTLLRQALVNLIDNAIKYAPERTAIRVTISIAGGSLQLDVADEGPGIALEHRERIFERFFRADRSRSRELGGTGLGLSMVRWVAEAHGGTATYLDNKPRGSVFRLVLPLTPDAGAEIDAEAS